MSHPAHLEPSRPPAPPSPAARPPKADDEAIRSLAVAIHRELRESLSPTDVVRLAAALLGQVADEVGGRRV